MQGAERLVVRNVSGWHADIGRIDSDTFEVQVIEESRTYRICLDREADPPFHFEVTVEQEL